MEDVVTITLPSGETMESNLSDHFGYQATVSYEEGKEYPRKVFVEPEGAVAKAARIAIIIVVIVLVVIAIAVGILVYCCCCKKDGEGGKFGKNVEMSAKA